MSAVDIQQLYALAGERAVALAEEMQSFELFLRQNYTISDFLGDSNIDREKRQEILTQACRDNSELFKEVVNLLLNEELMRDFSVITDNFLRLVEDKNAIRFAELRTAFPLEAGVQKQIEACVGMKLSCRVIADKGLLGGFKLKLVDGRELDASALGRLEQLKLEMVK